jgi:hypothetical protein
MNINISGVIGLSILINKKKNKKIFIFYDDHNNKKYCKGPDNDNKLFISKFCEQLINKYKNNVILILEEPFIEKNDNIKVLWENTKHLYLFRNFYTKLIDVCSNDKICYGFPTDIRLAIVDFTFDKSYLNENTNDTNYQITVSKYFNKILFIFDLDKLDIEYYDSEIIKFIKKVFSHFINSKYYINLKNKINKFYNIFLINNINKTLFEILNMYVESYKFKKGYPFNDSTDSAENDVEYNFFDEFDNILSAIMEFYMTIIITTSSKNIKLVYAGYYHSLNLKFILNKYYGYDIIYENGVTDNIEYVNENKIKNCISIDKSII